MSYLIILHICAFAFTVSLFVSGYLRCDHPDDLHQHGAIGTYGGAGPFAGLLCALFGLLLFYPGLLSARLLGGLSAFVGMAALVGWVDEMGKLSAQGRPIILAVLAAITPIASGVPVFAPIAGSGLNLPIWAGYSLAFIWIYVLLQIARILDQQNGLLGAVMMVASLGLCASALYLGAGDVAVLSAALAAATFGLLIYNFRRHAEINFGPIGAYVLAIWFAICTLRLTAQPAGWLTLYLGPLLLLPVLTDVGLTLLARHRRESQADNRPQIRFMFNGGFDENAPTRSGRTRSVIRLNLLYLVSFAVSFGAIYYGLPRGYIGSPFYVMVWICLANWIYLSLFLRNRRRA